jgi:phosphoribosyl 1,2-cyclic phosphate phosphodiesterase
MVIKFIGTSSGESIPRQDCDCAQCSSRDIKDKRLRPAILIDKKILVDAGPDILKQLTLNQINALEAVLITHDHNDHVGGIKDLLRLRKDIRIIKLKPGQHFKLLGIDFYAFKVKHSNLVPTVGVEAGPAIYIPDIADLEWAEKYLQESKIAILDGSVLGKNFGGHISMNEIISKTKEMKNLKKIYFTHNGHNKKPHKEMQKLVQEMGDKRYFLAYDGLEIEI